MIHLTRIVAVAFVLLAIMLGACAWLMGRETPPAASAVSPASAAVDLAPATPLFPIVVTTRPVPAGQPIAADALRVAHLPIRPDGSFGAADDIVGRVPVFDLAEGTPLFHNQLAAGLAQHLGDGERAVAVRADEAMGVGNRVQPGDFVDVFVVLKSDGKDIDRGQARLLLARKRVLAFGAASLESLPSRQNDGVVPQGQAQSRTPGAHRAEAARTAVLAVSVAEVARLALGESAGHLLLALRNPVDMASAEPLLYTGVTAAYFAAGDVSAGAPPSVPKRVDAPSVSVRRAPAGAVPRVTEVEFIRGDRRETLTY